MKIINLSPITEHIRPFFFKCKPTSTGLFNLLFNTTFTDIYSCYLCFKSDLFDFEILKTKGWEQHAEILAESIKNSSVYYEVPISYSGRTFEEGKKIRGRHVFKVIFTIIKKKLF